MVEKEHFACIWLINSLLKGFFICLSLLIILQQVHNTINALRHSRDASHGNEETLLIGLSQFISGVVCDSSTIILQFKLLAVFPEAHSVTALAIKIVYFLHSRWRIRSCRTRFLPFVFVILCRCVLQNWSISHLRQRTRNTDRFSFRFRVWCVFSNITNTDFDSDWWWCWCRWLFLVRISTLWRFYDAR